MNRGDPVTGAAHGHYNRQAAPALIIPAAPFAQRESLAVYLLTCEQVDATCFRSIQ